MAVVCRPARIDDLRQADEIVVASINDLTERRGFGRMASPADFSDLLAKGRHRGTVGSR